MTKLFTLITQACTAIAAILTLIADHYLETGGYLALVSLTTAILFMALPHLVDHYFIEKEPSDNELSFIVLRSRALVEHCENQPVLDP